MPLAVYPTSSVQLPKTFPLHIYFTTNEAACPVRLAQSLLCCTARLSKFPMKTHLTPTSNHVHNGLTFKLRRRLEPERQPSYVASDSNPESDTGLGRLWLVVTASAGQPASPMRYFFSFLPLYLIHLPALTFLVSPFTFLRQSNVFADVCSHVTLSRKL